MTNNRPNDHGRINGTRHLDRSLASARKRRLTVSLPQDLLERMRNSVYWTPHLTIAELVEDAVAARLLKMERANGHAYPKRTRELKPGRPRQRTEPFSESEPPPVMLGSAAPEHCPSSFMIQREAEEHRAVCLVE